MNENYRFEATLTQRCLLQPILQVWRLSDCMFFSHQGRKSHLFLISNNDTTQYAQSETKQRKKMGFLLPKGTDVIYKHVGNIFKNEFRLWNHFKIPQNLHSKCFCSLSQHWDMAYTVLAESLAACKLQPQMCEDFHIINKKKSGITVCEEGMQQKCF